jgi:carbon storage regulator CsrA
MLVLSRRPDEQIILPTVPAVIKVISTQAGLVRLGIEAPADVPIVREELTRGEPRPPHGERPQPGAHLRDRLNDVTRALARLRPHLSDAGPAVREALEAIEKELRDLRRQILSAEARGQEETYDAAEACV